MPLFRPNFPWPPYLAWARMLLTAATLAVAWRRQPESFVFFYGTIGLYLAYAIFLVIRQRRRGGLLGLLLLFIDTVVFLVLATFANEGLVWTASIFYLFLLTEALAFYGPVEVSMVAGICVLFCAALPYGAIGMLERTVVVAGALACGFAVTKRRLSDRAEEMKTALEEARATAAKAREMEQQRIASDFHDGPLQSFISLQMRLEILRKLLDRDFNAGMQDLGQLQTLAATQIRDLRAFLNSMRPVDVDGANLVASARRTAETFQKESGIPVTFTGSNTHVGLPVEMTGEVLQMLREALHNVQKHAGATRVAVAMEKGDRALEISVDDNGHGFNFAGTFSLEELELLRLGPASLKRRARALTADLLLESRPGRGAGLKFRIPLP